MSRVFRTKHRWADGSPVLGVKLKRLAPGYYETPDGKYTVVRVVYPHDGSVWWYWQFGDADVHDHHGSKWEAVDALARVIRGDV